MEEEINICPYCKQEIFCNKKVFANHVRWCKANPKFEEKNKTYKEKLIKKIKERTEEKYSHYKNFNVKCHICGKDIIVYEDERSFPNREKYFCSRSCANKRNHSIETRKKISEGIKRYCGSNEKEQFCEYCGKKLVHNTRSKFCDANCRTLWRKSKNNSIDVGYNIYIAECAFKFALNDYPNEYDFNLIKEFGWYMPKNHGNNLNGISRDHKFSRNKAWQLKVDPYIISHPANCELLQHNKNIGKNNKCSLSIEDLISNINDWHNKYGVYENKINYEIFNKLNIEFKIKY